jgi:hypothetical protein
MAAMTLPMVPPWSGYGRVDPHARPQSSGGAHHPKALGPSQRQPAISGKKVHEDAAFREVMPSSGRSQERVHDLGCTDEFRVDRWSISLDVPKEMIMDLPQGWEGR